MSSGPLFCAPIPDGSTVRLRDVARIEVGGLSYQFTTRRNGEPAAGLTVLLAPSANALATATAVKARMEALSKFFPANIKYDISYDITPVVIASIKKVLVTLAEAVVLVFLVMLLFLQNVRYTLIPTIVVPVALLGTCAALLLLRLSINMLTLFGMVLAIGILVDDAIVVVENVERIMSEEGLSPKRRDPQGHGADHRRDHRHHAGADVGVRADGVFSGIGRHHLPAVLGLHHRRRSGCLRSWRCRSRRRCARPFSSRLPPAASTPRAACSAGSIAGWSRPRTAMRSGCNGRFCAAAA